MRYGVRPAIISIAAVVSMFVTLSFPNDRPDVVLAPLAETPAPTAVDLQRQVVITSHAPDSYTWLPVSLPHHNEGLLRYLNEDQLRMIDLSPHGTIVDFGECQSAVVDRQSVCADTGSRISRNPRIQAWVRDVAGPSAFAVSVVGSSFVIGGSTLRILSRNGSTRSCVYAHLFLRPYVGSATLSVTRVLSSFYSLDETIDTVSVFLKDKVFSRALSVCTPPTRLNHGTVDGCLSRAAQPELWWEAVDVQQLKAEAAASGGLRYFPWQHKEFALRVSTCRLRGVPTSPTIVAEVCERKFRRRLRFLFTGDSHVRVLFRHFEAIAFNVAPSIRKGGNLSTYRAAANVSRADAERPKTRFGRVLEADYIWDPYLEALANRSDWLPDYDAVIFGAGAWPASFGQWSIDRFHAQMVQLAALIQQAHDRGLATRFFWVGGPAMPKPRRMPGFRITNYRLGVFNRIGGVVLGAAGAVWVDLFAMTLPVPKWNRGDGMHFDFSPVPFAALDWIISALCFS